MPEMSVAGNGAEKVVARPIETTWSATEFAGVDLGDRRLDDRLINMCADFAAQPQAQIPQASGNWAATKAAYRFFENPKVEAERLLAPHQQRTCTRLADQALALAAKV